MTIDVDASPMAAGDGTLKRRISIASYPDHNPGNPYIGLFYTALASHGIEHAGRLTPRATWLDHAGQGVDVIHIHWPERIWRGRRRGRMDRLIALAGARSIRGVLRLRSFLAEAGRRRITRVWTVHNVGHHEGVSRIDRWGYRELVRGSDLLVCFSKAAQEELRAEYGNGVPILVMPHGSYQGAYPPPRPASEARERWRLRPDLPVVSCLGLLRRYKGLDLACDAVEALGGTVQLLIAGQPHRGFDVNTLTARAASSGGTIVVLPRALSESEFSDAVAASDAVLLPYRSVTGSGVLFAAWTQGAGVIASDLPFFREMLAQHPYCGRLFRTGESEALATAIGEYLKVPAGVRREAIARAVESLSPERVVVPFVEELRRRHAGALSCSLASRG